MKIKYSKEQVHIMMVVIYDVKLMEFIPIVIYVFLIFCHDCAIRERKQQ